MALRVFAAILLALGCLLMVWPFNHYVTRVTVTESARAHSYYESYENPRIFLHTRERLGQSHGNARRRATDPVGFPTGISR